MATAYTPGMAVTADAVIRRARRLPIKGQVLVEAGQSVTPDTVIARTELPGPIASVRVAEQVGVDASELESVLQVSEGDSVAAGQLLAEVRSFFGLFTSRSVAPVEGKVEFASTVTGNVGIRQPPIPVTVDGYIEGRVVDILPEEGAVVETRGALVEGIFGVGGEQQGRIECLVEAADASAGPADVDSSHAGAILIAGARVSAELYTAAAAAGVRAIVGGGILDSDLREILGYDIGVAITGNEAVPCSLVVTEGFGELAMAARTFELLRSLSGRSASLSGATQIRAGVIRPEIIAPLQPSAAGESAEAPDTTPTELRVGSQIRIIREPYFGRLATVTALPADPVRIATGATVRVLECSTSDSETLLVPRANVELIVS